MKVISLLQPWASLVILGYKLIETRSWNTKYRGPLLIHASQGKQGIKLIDDPQFKRHLTPLFIDDPRSSFHYGAIIGIVNLIDVWGTPALAPGGGPGCETSNYKVDENEQLVKRTWNVTAQEIAFGDYSSGRFGWLLSDARSFKTPIPAKGKLQIWNLPEELLPQVQEQIRTAI